MITRWHHVRGSQDHPLLAGLSEDPRTQHLVLRGESATVERARPRGGCGGAVCGSQALASKGPVPGESPRNELGQNVWEAGDQLGGWRPGCSVARAV